MYDLSVDPTVLTGWTPETVWGVACRVTETQPGAMSSTAPHWMRLCNPCQGPRASTLERHVEVRRADA